MPYDYAAFKRAPKGKYSSYSDFISRVKGEKNTEENGDPKKEALARRLKMNRMGK